MSDDNGIDDEEMAQLADKATTHHVKELRSPTELIRGSGERLKEVLRDYQEIAGQVSPLVKVLRDKRMALTEEVTALLPPLRDVRKFFLEEGYEKEVGRLKEFVDLCERLERLKASGFLDRVADTLLKLSE